MSPLEENIIKTGQVNKLLELEPEPDIGEDEKSKIEIMKCNAIYIKDAKYQLTRLYYLIS